MKRTCRVRRSRTDPSTSAVSSRVTTMLQATSIREARQSARELKFLVDPAAAEGLLRRARFRLAADPHGTGKSGDEYTTTTLYFDTVELDVYHRRGSFKRSKYRIRRYEGTAACFLERKLRTSAAVVKRRTVVPAESLSQLTGLHDAGWAGHWFRQRLDLRRLAPTCQVSYRRTARVGRTDRGEIRLTCDRDISALDADELAFQPLDGTTVLGGQMIVEMKYRVELPGLFKQWLEEFDLEPAPVSKYRLSLEALGRPRPAPDACRPGASTDISDA